MTEESIDTSRLSDVARERDCTACAQLLCKTHALAASNCFPSGRSRCENKCACCECIETVDDVLEHMFLDFVTCSRKYTSTLSGKCVMARRLAPYCVCDHEIFMSFEIALSLNNVLGLLRNIPVLLFVNLRKQFCHQSVLVWRTEELPKSATESPSDQSLLDPPLGMASHFQFHLPFC